MKKIFFSYSREDSDFALKLASDLRAAGQAVWLDQLDIPAGARWDRAVEKALAECPNLLIILSPASVASPNVMDEVSFAIEEGKRLIPIVREQCQIPFRLRRFQYVDFTGDYDQALAFTLKDLARRDSVAMPIPDEPADTSTAVSSASAQPISPASEKSAQPAARQPAPGPNQPAVSEDRSHTTGGGRKATPWIIAAGLATVVVGGIGFTQGWFTSGTENGNGAAVPPAEGPVAIAAEFTASPTSGEAPLSVSFQDQSRGPVDRFQWDFGDGTNSTDRNPQHPYTTPGTYTVSLTASGSGGRDVVSKTDLITVERRRLQRQTPPTATNPTRLEEFRCMQGPWNETTGEGPGAPFTWTMTLSGNVLTVARDDGTATGRFTWNGSDFRGPLTWYDGAVWDNVVLAAPSRNCEYVETNQGWRYVRYRSVNSDTAVRITFRNATGGPVEVYWIDGEGSPVKYGDLQPGESQVQDTYATHPWQFRRGGQVLGYYTGTMAPSQSFDIES